eukprot:393403_1
MNETALKEIYDRHTSVITAKVGSNIDHFLNKATSIFDPAFEPNREDYLKCRIRTTGIIQTACTIHDMPWYMFDVNGQRNEHRKWLHLFEGVTVITFVAALNHYCEVLVEDERRNAMIESLELFDEMINSKYFRKSEIILILNKNDLFCENIRKQIPLSVAFNSEQYQ